MKHCDLIVVGAGILGLAHAYHAARAGMSVRVIERNSNAQGASTRNFGMLAVIAQAAGQQKDDALTSLRHWQQIGSQAGFTTQQSGCLILAQHPLELAVLYEFLDSESANSECRVVLGAELSEYAPSLNSEKLMGGLWSPDAWKIDQRNVLNKISAWLQHTYGVQFNYSTEVNEITPPLVATSKGAFKSQAMILCGGNEFSSLFPESFQASGVTHCELQMLRTQRQPGSWKLKPFVLGGLSLARYASFADCSSLSDLEVMQQQRYGEYIQHGIHVIACQEPDGSITIGDSHAYSTQLSASQQRHADFHESHKLGSRDIDHLIMEELSQLIALPEVGIEQRWCGHYAHLPGTDVLTLSPAENVLAVTATHGQGMTHSFAIAEEAIHQIL